MKDIWVIIGLLLTNAGFLFGMWRYFTTRIENSDSINESRVSRVYERFDEHKRTVEGLYVRKDACSLLHNNTADNLKNVELRMLAQFEKIDKKLDEFYKIIMELLKK